MTSSEIFYGIADFMQMTFRLLEADMIGNIFNYSVIVLGFVGLFIWLNMQKKYNAAAESNPDQIK